MDLPNRPCIACAVCIPLSCTASSVICILNAIMIIYTTVPCLINMYIGCKIAYNI